MKLFEFVKKLFITNKMYHFERRKRTIFFRSPTQINKSLVTCLHVVYCIYFQSKLINGIFKLRISGKKNSLDFALGINNEKFNKKKKKNEVRERISF